MDTLAAVLYIILIIAIIIAIPFVFIWSLNTLFHLGIAYNIWTWLAALFLSGAVVVRWNNSKDT